MTAVGEIETPTTGIIETETDNAFVGSASGEAVICTVAGEGASEAAVYTPLEEIVPQAVPEQPAPETDQEIVGLGFDPDAGTSVAV